MKQSVVRRGIAEAPVFYVRGWRAGGPESSRPNVHLEAFVRLEYNVNPEQANVRRQEKTVECGS